MSLHTLKSDRLIMRPLTLGDWKAVQYLRTDPIVNKYVDRPPAPERSDAEAFINKIITATQTGLSYYWVIQYAESPEMIGSICLWNFTDDRKIAELGYDLSVKFQRKGIMTESLNRIIEFAREELSLNTLYAYTHFNNLASTMLLRNAGFRIQENMKDADNKNNIIFRLDLV